MIWKVLIIIMIVKGALSFKESIPLVKRISLSTVVPLISVSILQLSTRMHLFLLAGSVVFGIC